MKESVQTTSHQNRCTSAIQPVMKRAGFPLLLLLVLMATAGSFSGSDPADLNNVYEAKLKFAEEEVSLSGRSTFTTMPHMYTFYLEESESIQCALHVLRLKEEGLQRRTYKAQPDESPGSAVVCGVPYDEESKERLASVNGEVTIIDFSRRHISGSYDLELVGDKSGKTFTLSGTFVSFPRI